MAAAAPADVASLTLKKAVDLIRSKGASPVELTQACLKRIEQYNAEAQRLHHRHPGAGARRGAGDGSGTAAWEVARAAARGPDRAQRQHRHGRRPHHRRERTVQGPRPVRRCRSRPATEEGGRHPARQAQSSRVRLRRLVDDDRVRHDAQPVGTRPRHRRIVGRTGRRRRRGPLLRVARDRYRRIRPHARRALRHRRVEADLRAGQHARRHDACRGRSITSVRCARASRMSR